MANITTLFLTLTTLVASSNLYTTLTPHSLHPIITNLTLEDNLFPSLSSLNPLTGLPTLQRLVLKSNKISIISPPGTPSPTFSPTLTEVDLSFNEISIWPFIDALAHVFPGLTALRVSHNPLYQNLQAADGHALTTEDGYMLTLGRLGNLTSLNYSPVLPKERLNAESYYLSLIGRELTFASPNLEAKIMASHPRYEYLCSEYGEPFVNRTDKAVNPNSLAASLIRFAFYLGESIKATSSQLGAETREDKFEAEIPMNFTSYSLLGLVGKRFRIKPMNCRLIYEMGDRVPTLQTRTLKNSDSDSESDQKNRKEKPMESVIREVEIIPGTRAVGTWVDGREAVVRIEVR